MTRHEAHMWEVVEAIKTDPAYHAAKEKRHEADKYMNWDRKWALAAHAEAGALMEQAIAPYLAQIPTKKWKAQFRFMMG